MLDLKRNRYLGIGKEEARALRTLALNWSEVSARTTHILEPPAPEAAAYFAIPLIKAGLLSREATADKVITPGSIDLDSTLASVGHQLDRPVTLRPDHVINFLRACTWAKWVLRSRTLYSVAEEINSIKLRSSKSFDEQLAIELVSVFRRLRPFTFTAKDQCLFHALALVKFLSYYEVFPAWVIGIRARPWAAHSWVQQGNLLLDSNPEHVCEYSPILVV